MTEMSKWYQKTGPEFDVVCSTRVRLARNLQKYSFPEKANTKEKEEIKEDVKKTLMSASRLMSEQFEYVPLEKLSMEEAVSLVERHTVSPEFISNIQGKAVLLSKDEHISIMINEEDHIRIQVIQEGFSAKEAFETAGRIEMLLGEHLEYAFNDKLGYLTQCPTNLGTGLRVSYMLHLPALAEYGLMSRMMVNLSKLGMTIRGTFGEGTDVVGSMYQLSNQITLGLSEAEAIENLSGIAMQLISEERNKRAILSENIAIQDKISRAAGVLKSAKILTNDEFMTLASYAKLGISMGLIEGIRHEQLNTLITETQPATLIATEKRKLTAQERDVLRAERVNNIFIT